MKCCGVSQLASYSHLMLLCVLMSHFYDLLSACSDLGDGDEVEYPARQVSAAGAERPAVAGGCEADAGAALQVPTGDQRVGGCPSP